MSVYVVLLSTEIPRICLHRRKLRLHLSWLLVRPVRSFARSVRLANCLPLRFLIAPRHIDLRRLLESGL